MGEKAKADFSGYATKAGLRCTDGRTITSGAFREQDGVTVPLVWQHQHSSPENVLGHVILHHRDDGTYCSAYFNNTEQATTAKELVAHKDIKHLSIWANQLVEKSKQVLHGVIKEVSLVLGGANPGALIDNIEIVHGDGEIESLADEAIIFTDEEIVHGDGEKEDGEDDTSDELKDGGELEHDDGPTVQEIYTSMTDDQKSVVHIMVGSALESAGSSASHDDDSGNKVVHSDDKDEEGRDKVANVFEDEKAKKDKKRAEAGSLSHDDMKEIFTKAQQFGSLREAYGDRQLSHGIDDIDVLFPEARNVTDMPEFNKRRTEWVADVLDGTRHSPFARVKSIVADLTYEEARAKGYIKGSFKKEEWIGVSKRITTPATIYKKQKLDRDDIVDITDFDVVVWLKMEMRLMFDEELARAILIGDGREADDPDKVQDPSGAVQGAGIRSILHDHDLYAPTFTVPDDAVGTELSDGITKGMAFYKGSGGPKFYTTQSTLTNMLLTRVTAGDGLGQRMWKTKDELATELQVSDIVVVESMEDEEELVGIIVNLRDYTIGADKGGETTFFDFFDIDYNQYKYLYEARLSGALTRIRSAIVIKWAAEGDTLVAPEKPDFDGSDVVVADTAHVVYKDGDGSTVTDSTISLDPGESVTVFATPASGYYFENNVRDEWKFTNRSSE